MGGGGAKISALDKLPGGTDRRGEILTWQDFRTEVGRAMRNGDKHPVKEAEGTAHLAIVTAPKVQVDDPAYAGSNGSFSSRP